VKTGNETCQAALNCLVDEVLARLPALYFLMVSHFILHTSMNSKKPPKQTKQTRYNKGIPPGFASVVNAFVQDKQVTRDEGKGFGSCALKVNGKIFAMMTSQHKFVVKLPKARVDELVRANLGENFAPRPGRLMKEWLVVFPTNNHLWVELASEAHHYVRQGVR
jgi:hypothetical protein